MNLVTKINDITEISKINKNTFIKELQNKGFDIDDNATYKDISNYINKIDITNNNIHLNGISTSFINSEWVELSSLPSDFIKHKSVVYNGDIHILGGDGTKNSTLHYKYDGTSWTKVSTLPFVFIDGQAVVYRDCIHIIGSSYNSTVRPYHYRYNGTSWTKLTNSPASYPYGGYAVNHNDKIHSIGGTYTYNDRHYTWNGSKWTSIKSVPFDTRYGCGVSYNNHIYAIGSSISSSKNRWSRWSDETSSWDDIKTLSASYTNAYAVVYNNSLHLLGGSETKRHYSFNGSKWTLETTHENLLYYGACVIWNEQFHILGGTGTENKHYVLSNITVNNTIIVKNTSTIYHESTEPTITKINDEYDCITYVKDEYLTIKDNDKITFIHSNKDNKCYLPKGSKINGNIQDIYGVIDYPNYPCIIE